MPRQARPRRLAVRFTGPEHAEVARRARAHGVPMAEYMRRAALAGMGGPADGDDEWWHHQPPARKAQMRRWLDKDPAGPPPDLPPLPLELD